MIDLNTVLNTALTQALNEALKPLLERIATIESSVQHLDVWSTSTGNVMTDRLTALEARVMTTTDSGRLDAIHDRLTALDDRVQTIEMTGTGTTDAMDDLIDDRIGNFLDNDDLASRIDVDNLEGLENVISNTLDGMDLADTVRPVVEELLTNASITLG